ncbi:MAG: hypothetical protein SGI88_17860 [Candidatus Hydrogenedentes bacterium]|nr:hypothetical protein [Candidatus Hydrogenedentota bacterium]
MKHIRRMTALPAYAFGEVRPNPFLKLLEPISQGLVLVLRKKGAEKAPAES